jgi:hypothetical protein
MPYQFIPPFGPGMVDVLIYGFVAYRQPRMVNTYPARYLLGRPPQLQPGTDIRDCQAVLEPRTLARASLFLFAALSCALCDR